MNTLQTRASSINRALDQVGDKWCLLILREVFWGINTFNDMRATLGVSRGVLADRLAWLQAVDCLAHGTPQAGGKRKRYYLTDKSLALYDCALAALAWERAFFSTPELDRVQLLHRGCGRQFTPVSRCAACDGDIRPGDVSYSPGPGAGLDERGKKTRRRSSIPVDDVPSEHRLYRNLVNIVGDRWTANLIALAFHGLHRFESFHRELPIATNILSDRLRFLVDEGIFLRSRYSERPPRFEYHLTGRGEALFPWFLALLQWGDRWCSQQTGRPMLLQHDSCGQALVGEMRCSACGQALHARDVVFDSAR